MRRKKTVWHGLQGGEPAEPRIPRLTPNNPGLHFPPPGGMASQRESEYPILAASLKALKSVKSVQSVPKNLYP